jgi:hypothetical protein
MASLNATEVAFKKIAKEHGRILTVTILTGSTVTSKVPDDVKEKAAAILRGVEEQLVASVTVITGDGVGVTILRAFMTAFSIFSKIKRPQKAFADLETAMAWIRTLDESAVGELTADKVRKHFALPKSKSAAATLP